MWSDTATFPPKYLLQHELQIRMCAEINIRKVAGSDTATFPPKYLLQHELQIRMRADRNIRKVAGSDTGRRLKTP